MKNRKAMSSVAALLGAVGPTYDGVIKTADNPLWRPRHASGKVEKIRGPAARCGRNELCPCGSGKKYKKCCLPKG